MNPSHQELLWFTWESKLKIYVLINIWKEAISYSRIGNHRLAMWRVYLKALGFGKNRYPVQHQCGQNLHACHQVRPCVSSSLRTLLDTSCRTGGLYECHMITSNGSSWSWVLVLRFFVADGILQESKFYDNRSLYNAKHKSTFCISLV